MYTVITGEYDVRCGVLLSRDHGILPLQVDPLAGSQTICSEQPQYSGMLWALLLLVCALL